jgi:hypothetical protein
MSRSLLRHVPLVIAVAVLVAPVHDLVVRLRHRGRAPEISLPVRETAPGVSVPDTPGDELPEDGRPGEDLPGAGLPEAVPGALPGTIGGVRRSSSGEEIALSATSGEFALLLYQMRSADRLREVRAERSGEEWVVHLSLNNGGSAGARGGPGTPVPAHRSGPHGPTQESGFSVDDLAGALAPGRPSPRSPETARSDGAANTRPPPVSFGMVRFASGTTFRWYRRADLLRLERAP